METYCESLGYPVAIEKGRMGAHNIVIGDPTTARYLVTAHYDTCAHLPFPNFITPCNLFVYLAYQIFVVGLFFAACALIYAAMFFVTKDSSVSFLVAYVAYFALFFLMMFGPANKHNANDNTSGVVTLLEIARTMPEGMRERVCFVLFDLEEAGLIGSSSYRMLHKNQTQQQIILNLDCVGDGDTLMMFPTKKLQKDAALLDELEKICGVFGSKSLQLHRKGFAMYPSDQKNFPLGVGIAAFRRKKLLGLYCSRIHTNRDTILEQTNVNLLRAALTSLITGSAAK